jgi:GH3 auxin-responsive promoter
MNPRTAALLAALEPHATVAGDPWSRLCGLLEKHADTEFGRTHGFHSIRSPEDFREAIPPMNYEDHRSWIGRAANGERGVLACDEPVGFERTSGTLSRPKWIPLTAGLQEEFARGLAAWFGGWRTRRPEVFAGRAYWTLSPAGMAAETTPGGLQVGMASDAAYFPEAVGARLAEWLVVPGLSGDLSTLFEETAEALLATPDLSLVSVWSPTFLLGIDAAVQQLRPGKSWSELWPKLALASCWADASSASWIPLLQERLGKVAIEPKGLLATEGITSLPDAIDGSPRLAAECHWHEFLDEDGHFTELRDLSPGCDYEVLLTTAGGLFRYCSGDRVRVVSTNDLPRLRFIGRRGAVSDLVGEKLHESEVLAAFLQSGGRGFLVSDPGRPGYELWLENVALAAGIVDLLRRNPYFDQALRLHQLSPPRVHRLPPGWPLKLSASLASLRGARLGDVKLPVIIMDHRPEEVATWLA